MSFVSVGYRFTGRSQDRAGAPCSTAPPASCTAEARHSSQQRFSAPRPSGCYLSAPCLEALKLWWTYENCSCGMYNARVHSQTPQRPSSRPLPFSSLSDAPFQLHLFAYWHIELPPMLPRKVPRGATKKFNTIISSHVYIPPTPPSVSSSWMVQRLNKCTIRALVMTRNTKCSNRVAEKISNRDLQFSADQLKMPIG